MLAAPRAAGATEPIGTRAVLPVRRFGVDDGSSIVVEGSTGGETLVVRGTVRDTDGRPVDYTIPDDGPVGTMLQVGGRHPWRPAHIHFAVAAPGYEPLVTHFFDAASPYLEADTVFAVRVVDYRHRRPGVQRGVIAAGGLDDAP